MERKTHANEIPRVDLEALALGTLPAHRAQVIRQAAQEDAGLQARIDRIGREIEGARQDMPDLGFDPLELPDARPQGFQWPRLFWPRATLGFGFAAAMALALIVVVPPAQEDAGVLYRGALDLRVDLVRFGKVLPQGALVHAQAGDHLQFDISAPKAGYLSIFNIQGDGQIQTYYPSTWIEAQSPETTAVRLDDYGGAERIFFLLSDDPLEAEHIGLAYEAEFTKPLADMDRLSGLDLIQRSIFIIKEPSP